MKKKGMSNNEILIISIIVSVFVLIFFSVFPFYGFLGFVFRNKYARYGVSILVFFFLKNVLPTRKSDDNGNYPHQCATNKAKEEISKQNVSQIKKHENPIVLEGSAHINNLINLRSKIDTPEMKKRLEVLIKLTEQIYEYVLKYPEYAHKIKKLNDYYIPKTIILLNSYDDFENILIPTENIKKSILDIELAMDKLIDVFVKQIENLLYDKSFDIRAELKVLDTVLSQDGYKKNI